MFLVDMAHFSGLVAAGVYPNPCEYADIVTSTTHKTLRGPRVGNHSGAGEVRQGDRQEGVPRHAGRASGSRGRGEGGLLPGSDAPEFVEYQKQVVANAKALAAEPGRRGIPNRFRRHRHSPDAGRRVCERVRGKEAEQALDHAHITVNKNAIPFDTNPPLNPSGIRLGTPAVTTRGFREAEMREVSSCIAQVLGDHLSEDNLASVRTRVKALTDQVSAV